MDNKVYSNYIKKQNHLKESLIALKDIYNEKNSAKVIKKAFLDDMISNDDMLELLSFIKEDGELL